MPTGFTVNTTDISFSTSTQNGCLGTKFGKCSIIRWTFNNVFGGVYLDSNSNILLWGEVGNGAGFNQQSSSYYSYDLTNLRVDFDAMIPIN